MSVDRDSDLSSSHPQSGRSRLGAVAALIILALGLGIAYWLLSQSPRVERRAAPPAPPPRVEIASIEAGPAAPVVQGYGRVIAARQTEVASRVGGRLISFAEVAEPGRVVEDGALLATLDNSDYQLALRTAQAELEQAQASLAIERAEQIRARSEYESFGRQLSAERRALVLREPQLKSAQAAVDSAQVALETAQLDLARTQIEAPYRAMIQERLVGPGSEVSANTSLLSLVDVSHFWVRVSLPSEALDWLDTGQGDATGAAVKLTSRGWPQGYYRQGRVFSVLPDLEENGLLAQVMVRVDDPLALNSDLPALRLGDVVSASFDATPREGLITLPTVALRSNDRIWVVDESNHLRIHDVDVVYQGEERLLIEADDSVLSPGQRVIVSNLGQAREGMALRVAGDTAADEASAVNDPTAETPDDSGTVEESRS